MNMRKLTAGQIKNIIESEKKQQKKEDLAKKIALLLAESKTRFDDIDYVFMVAKSFLVVNMED
jgi:hypothetical protein